MSNIYRIHIIFNCKEDHRITAPIIKSKPNKIYYFTAIVRDTGQCDEHMEYYYKNMTLIKNELPLIKITHKVIDYTNYTEIIQELSKIIRRERKKNFECEILIDIGSGSNITALASAEVARLWNCKVFYTYSTHYNPSGEGARHKGEILTTEPLLLPIKKTKKIFIKVLKIIDNALKKKYLEKETKSNLRFIYKKQLLELLIEKGFLKLQVKHHDPRSLQSSYYMKINQRFLKPLADELKYIKISKDKRNKKILLTKKGKIILKIFKYLT